MPRIDVRKKLAEFDRLPDDCIVDDPVAAALLGMSIDTLQRANPVPKKQFSKRRVGRRAGDIRALIRGNAAA
jgi:hypothetical protein